jgi:transposase
MDDTALQRYFAQPTQLYQRQYEALRAVVYEGKSQKDAAGTFGFHYDSFRQLMHQFRSYFVAEQAPTESPFFGRSRETALPQPGRITPRQPFRQ